MPYEIPAPMLAKSVPKVPEQDAVAGGFSYEPKWDGFRGLVSWDGENVEIGSRGAKPLTRYFPELVEAFARLNSRRITSAGTFIGSALAGCKQSLTSPAMAFPQAPLHLADRGAARLLRGRRSRHQDRRAGDRALRPAGLCAARNRPQPLRRRPAARAGRGLRQGTGRGAGRPSGRLLRPWRAEGRAGRGRRRAGSTISMRPARWSARSTARRERLIEAGRHILFIGHAGHPEVIGTFGQVPRRTR